MGGPHSTSRRLFHPSTKCELNGIDIKLAQWLWALGEGRGDLGRVIVFRCVTSDAETETTDVRELGERLREKQRLCMWLRGFQLENW